MQIIKLFVLAILLAVSTSSVYAQEAPKAPAAQQAYTAKTPQLTKAQIDEWLTKQDEVLFIDVRRPDEVSKIGGFPVYLSIQSKDLEANLDYIPTDRAIITVSNHAGRAGKAADLLVDKGFNVVGAAGVETYEAEGGKITKIEIPAPKPQAK